MAELSEFAGRVVVLASMHKKEQVIAPLLEAKLGVKLQVLPNFNTDQFGTFSREQARTGSQLEAARAKAHAALALMGSGISLRDPAPLVIASEGSFGPHPSLPYLACNREVLLFRDPSQNLEVVGEALSVETNFRQKTVRNLTEALAFAEQVGFPAHGLMVLTNPEQPGTAPIFKGITTVSALDEAIQVAIQSSSQGLAHLETDMRAHYNPTRMRVIAAATEDLLNKLMRCCPNCGRPGFAIQRLLPGLPCQVCQMPTPLTVTAIYECQRCQHQLHQNFPEGMNAADPTYCNYCNP
jgi:phage FluMu protein gp41